VRHFAPFLAFVGLASSATAQADSNAMRVMCDEAAKVWAPVRMPEAGINSAIPCNDAELNAYKNSNEERKQADGLAGCERDGRTFLVMYMVNTPAGFFDNFIAEWKATPVQNFQVEGHRVFRAAKTAGGEGEGEQLIEIDPRRAVLMWTSSKVPNDPDFSKLTSCFFNTLHFLKGERG
jgi:hypothetical protein